MKNRIKDSSLFSVLIVWNAPETCCAALVKELNSKCYSLIMSILMEQPEGEMFGKHNVC